MAQILITPSQVHSVGQDFRGKKSEVDALIQKANTLINQLQDSFKGQRATSIYNEWAGIYPALLKASIPLEDAANLLTRAADAFEQVDTQR